MTESRRIGVVINMGYPHADDQQLYRGILRYAREHEHFNCVLAPFAADDLSAAPQDRLPYDGILAQATPDLVDQSIQSGVPVVDVWRDSPVRVKIPCVFPDCAMAGRMAADHLASRGFEHFGYVVSTEHQGRATMCDVSLIGLKATATSCGFAARIASKGLPCSRFIAPPVVDQSARIWQQWVADIRAWIEDQPKPLALFVPQDMLCRYIADLAFEMELKVPHDLGLICADNEPNFCSRAEPSLSSIDIGYKRVGYQAAALLDQILDSGKKKWGHELVLVEPNALVARRSTDAVVLDDPMVAKAMRFILEHSHEPIMVLDVAQAVSSTRRTVERRFRTVLDRTVTQEITRSRLERLKRRLAESDELLKVLAEDSGFNSVRTLYETFVREEGISPTAYRAKRRLGS